MTVPQEIVDFINTSRAPRPPIADPDEPLGLDSLAFIRLISFLDNDLNIQFGDDDLTSDNFDTLRRIGELLASRAQLGDKIG